MFYFRGCCCTKEIQEIRQVRQKISMSTPENPVPISPKRSALQEYFNKYPTYKPSNSDLFWRLQKQRKREENLGQLITYDP